jgi:MFS family permease
MFGFENAGRGILPMPVAVALLGGGICLLGLYYRHTRATAAPIIDLSLLRVATYRASILGGFVFRMGLGALPFLTPLMLQLGFGMTPFASGMITFAGAAGAMTMKFTAGPIIRRFGYRKVLLFNTIISAAFMASYGFFEPSTPHLVIILTLLVGGFFRSLQFTAINTIAYADIDNARMSRATTLSSVGQQLSLSFGVGIGALALHVMLTMSGREQLAASDFSPAYFLIAGLSLMSLFFFAPLAGNAGDSVSGRVVDGEMALTAAEPARKTPRAAD